jgi:uncharacterized protein (DUF697 family)
MTAQEKEAILAVALMAAFADNNQQQAEHEAVRRVADGFQMDAMDLGATFQKVLTKQVTLEGAAAALESPEAKSLAYELARSVCEASGPVVPEEQQFLASLAAALLARGTAAVPQAAVVPAAAPIFPDMPEIPAAPTEDLEPVLLKYAILTAALELLPQTTGSLAIVPTQMKMVYDIGKRHGIALDRNSLKDFGAALGIGAVSQVLEGGLRKILSGVMGGLGGKSGVTVGDLTGGVAGTAMTFATTYALGTVADRYYASGRQMDIPTLKAEFNKLLETAKTKGTEYSGDITAKATELAEKFKDMDFSKILGGLRPGQ